MKIDVLRTGSGMLLVGTALVASMPAAAQTASQITPQTLAPPTTRAPARVELPQGAGPIAPAGAEALEVALADVRVTGATLPPDVIADLRERLAGKRVTVAAIYAAARSLEARFARQGRVLVRVTVPPQQLDDGATLSLDVVEGFIERVDTDAVPPRIRARTAALLAKLVGRTDVTLAQIERALLIAADQPGMRLRSTLAPGDRAGATVLVVDATHGAVTGLVSFDNSLSSQLGTYALGVGATFNSLLGQGETVYLRAGGYPGGDYFGSNPLNRLLAAGAMVPIGHDGLTLTTEAVASRTTPEHDPARPGFGSRFRRLSARLAYPLVRRRDVTIGIEGAFDAQRERVAIVSPVLLPLSFDDLRIARLSLSGSTALAGDGVLNARVQWSQGIDGLGARSAKDASVLLPLSRQGSDAAFTKLDWSASASQPVARHLELGLRARAQTSFGKALANAEQFGIATVDDLSPLPAATLQGDTGVVTRAEVRAPFTLKGPNPVGRIVPYAFAGWGQVRYALPTALERGRTDATAYGLGARLVARASEHSPTLVAGAEYGRATIEGRPGSTDRFLISVTSNF